AARRTEDEQALAVGRPVGVLAVLADDARRAADRHARDRAAGDEAAEVTAAEGDGQLAGARHREDVGGAAGTDRPRLRREARRGEDLDRLVFPRRAVDEAVVHEARADDEAA